MIKIIINNNNNDDGVDDDDDNKTKPIISSHLKGLRKRGELFACTKDHIL